MTATRHHSPALVFWALAIAVAGCATVGHKFNDEKVDILEPGVSTSADAIELLGKPTAESTYPDGSKLLQWQYSQGTLVGGSGAHVAILFDPDGKMVRVTHRFKT